MVCRRGGAPGKGIAFPKQFIPNHAPVPFPLLSQAAQYNVTYPLVDYGYVAELKGSKVPAGLGLGQVRPPLNNTHACMRDIP